MIAVFFFMLWGIIVGVSIWVEEHFSIGGLTTGISIGVMLSILAQWVLNYGSRTEALKYTYNELPAWNPLRWLGYLRQKEIMRRHARRAMRELQMWRHVNSYVYGLSYQKDGSDAGKLYVHLTHNHAGQRRIVYRMSEGDEKEAETLFKKWEDYQLHIRHFEEGRETIEYWRNFKVPQKPRPQKKSSP